MSVDNKVILELKSVEAMKDVHVKKGVTCEAFAKVERNR
jgi:hypothetical protein